MAVRAAHNIFVRVGTEQLEREVNNIAWAPDTAPTWKGGTPDATYTDDTGQGTLSITLVQDHSEDSAWSVFYDAEPGTEMTIIYSMVAAGSDYFETKIKSTTPSLGGAVGSFNESTLTFPAPKPTRVTKPA